MIPIFAAALPLPAIDYSHIVLTVIASIVTYFISRRSGTPAASPLDLTGLLDLVNKLHAQPSNQPQPPAQQAVLAEIAKLIQQRNQQQPAN